MSEFSLSKTFLKSQKNRVPNFGFNGLGELVYLRTYSRVKENGEKEEWWETCKRVVEWVYNTQKEHIERQRLGWDNKKAQASAQEMYERIFDMKFLPPGRGLWIAGTEVLKNKPVAAALNNCAFVSTDSLDKDCASPFAFLMDMSMLGVGVGFDTKGAGKVTIQEPRDSLETIVIDDSREGWVGALESLIKSYLLEGNGTIEFDYSQIRKYGEPIKGFGGVASGYEPLKELLDNIKSQFEGRAGELVTSEDIVNIMNRIGVCVVSGNVRRTAEIAIGDYRDKSYMKLKDYRYNAETGQYDGSRADRASYGWTSNNSIFAEVGMNYDEIGEQIAMNGEPGIAWLENMRDYSRMNGNPDYKDHRVVGVNPCVEQSLEDKELCCLVETFPTRCSGLDDYKRTLKFAYLYAKTVTLCNTHWEETNRVMLRNRRIGTSMSGVAQMIDSYGIDTLKQYCESGYDEIAKYDNIYSEWLCVPKSIKTTSVKPSGSVSLLAGVTPGVHFPENTTYIRRMRIAASSDMVQPLIDAGYTIEKDLNDQSGKTLVVEIPVKVEGVRKQDDVSMWEQLSIAAFMQKYWADNQVSATITFDPEKDSKDIAKALNYFQYQLKGISFLPKVEKGAYHQMPYESIDDETYNNMISKLKKIQWKEHSTEEAVGEKFCTNDSCSL